MRTEGLWDLPSWWGGGGAWGRGGHLGISQTLPWDQPAGEKDLGGLESEFKMVAGATVLSQR